MGSRRGLVRLVRESEASWRRGSRVLTHYVCRSGFVTGSKGAEFHFNLGRSYFDAGRWAEAEKYLLRSLSCKDLDDRFA
jgi:Tetratricopeptide repeat